MQRCWITLFSFLLGFALLEPLAFAAPTPTSGDSSAVQAPASTTSAPAAAPPIETAATTPGNKTTDSTTPPGFALAAPMAKVQGIDINADSFYRDSDQDLLQLTGHVQVVYQGQYIECDEARVFLRSKRLEAFGHVHITSQKANLNGDEIFLDYENNTGLIYNGSVTSGTVAFEGKILEKIGDEEYFVSDANYTTCTNCPATWSFKGTTIRAQLGGYAYIKNTVIHISDFPVLYLPYMIVPLKSDRQSGFLTPIIEQSQLGGVGFAMPYFWAISRSSDLTATPEYYSLRGWKAMGDYRYMLNQNSSGEVAGASIRDHAFGGDPRLNTFRTGADVNQPVDRWYVRSANYYDMPDGYIARAQVNMASDLQYPKDFPLETMNLGDSAMENRFSLTKNDKDQHFSLDSSYYVNMLQSNPLANNDNAVQRLPELRFSQVDKNIGTSNFIYSVNVDYTNFTRSGNGYDELEPYTNTQTQNTIERIPIVGGIETDNNNNPCNGDPNWDQHPGCHLVNRGYYDPTNDLIRTGQRLSVQPALSYPILLDDGIDMMPKISYNETRYVFQEGDDKSIYRRYFRAELDNKMDFTRIYGDNSPGSHSTVYKHEIVPEISYIRIPWLDQMSSPFFGQAQRNEVPYTLRDSAIGDADLSNQPGTFGLQFDYDDRIYDSNLVTVALTNKLIEKKWLNDTPQYNQIFFFRIAESYDIAQESAGAPWSDFAASMEIRLKNFQTYSSANYFPYQGLWNTSSRVRVIDDVGRFLQLGITKQYTIIPGQPVDQSTRTDDYTLSAGFISKYVNLMARLMYDANFQGIVAETTPTTSNVPVNHNQLKSWGYIAQFKPPGDCWIIDLMQSHIDGGDTNFAFSFEFNFDGQPQKPKPPEALDAFGF